MRPVARALVLALVLALAPAAASQGRQVEVGARVESLSGPFADGQAAYLRAVLPRPSGWLRLDAAAETRFGYRSGVAGLALGQDLSDRWTVTAGVGGSTAGLARPRAEAGVGLGRRWGARKAVLTLVGAAVRDARDVHRDLDATAEVVVYGEGLTVQAGGRLTRSDPGGVLGGAGHLAVTVGAVGGRSLAARLAAGHEAWLLVEPAPLDVAFRSWEAEVTWREPLGRRWATTASAGLYANPYYTRLGVQTGLVHRF